MSETETHFEEALSGSHAQLTPGTSADSIFALFETNLEHLQQWRHVPKKPSQDLRAAVFWECWASASRAPRS